MRTPEQVRDRLAIAWTRNWTGWLGGGGDWPLVMPLDAPTEARASRHWTEFVRWLECWQAYPGPGRVRHAIRSWPRRGAQTIPTHIEFGSPSDVSRALGGQRLADFTRADARMTDRAAAWPECGGVLRSHADWLASLSDEDFERAVRVIDWLADHPDCGLYPRQIPVEGVDTKWVERNAGPVGSLLADRLGAPRGPLATVAGLQGDLPKRRLRVLDPALRAKVGGFSDLTVRIDELARLDLGAPVIVVIENLQSLLACADQPGVIAVAGGGFAAAELGQIPWLHERHVVYWGDIDQAGFEILARLRGQLPHTRSCLMDEQTLLAHRGLWVVDPTPAKQALPLNLTPDELRVAQGLASGTWGLGVRLEQERIPWPYAWARLTSICSTLATSDTVVPPETT